MSEAFADCLTVRRRGVSRQAFYSQEERTQRTVSYAMLVLDLVAALRREIPGFGTRKLHLLLAKPLAESGIKMGRDKLHKLLQDHSLVLRQHRQTPQTTDSNHRMHKYRWYCREKQILG